MEDRNIDINGTITSQVVSEHKPKTAAEGSNSKISFRKQIDPTRASKESSLDPYNVSKSSIKQANLSNS
jgi:hypothetical protein